MRPSTRSRSRARAAPRAEATRRAPRREPRAMTARFLTARDQAREIRSSAGCVAASGGGRRPARRRDHLAGRRREHDLVARAAILAPGAREDLGRARRIECLHAVEHHDDDARHVAENRRSSSWLPALEGAILKRMTTHIGMLLYPDLHAARSDGPLRALHPPAGYEDSSRVEKHEPRSRERRNGPRAQRDARGLSAARCRFCARRGRAGAAHVGRGGPEFPARARRTRKMDYRRLHRLAHPRRRRTPERLQGDDPLGVPGIDPCLRRDARARSRGHRP